MTIGVGLAIFSSLRRSDHCIVTAMEQHPQGKVINVQPGFLGWFFNKNPSWNGANSVKTILGLSVQGGNSGKTILGLSVQGGNRYGSTLVLSNKNHVRVIIIFILQHAG